MISNLTKLKFHGKALPFHDAYNSKEKAPMSAGQKFKCEVCGKEIWENDRTKDQEILKSGFGILRYWESDLKDISHDKIFEDIVHASMKVED